ncbi:MAG: helix-turn-helix domain-containing protein [Dysgonamonadaceae bacterium]|jgi:transcriptional regulator with XRE-family HTH domain|nr:helix-turn-helix domain-containing protein [Dysgonamonadaceae bacterium]
MKNIHIGSLIYRIVKERKISITDFARAIHYSRSNVYSIFNRQSINRELLKTISKVLNYNFEAVYLESMPRNFLVVIKTNELKLNELASDNSVAIILSQEVSK